MPSGYPLRTQATSDSSNVERAIGSSHSAACHLNSLDSARADDEVDPVPASRQHHREAQSRDGDASTGGANHLFARHIVGGGIRTTPERAHADGKDRGQPGPSEQADTNNPPQGAEIDPVVHRLYTETGVFVFVFGATGTMAPPHASFTFLALTAFLRDRQ